MDFQKDIIDTVNELISFIDKDYKYVFTNKAYSKYYKCQPNEIIGKSISDFLGEELFIKKIKPHFDKCLKGEHVEYRNILSFNNGKSKRYMLIDYYPHYNENNQIDGLIATIKDKTGKFFLKENWINAIEALDDIACMVDFEYNILDINKHGLSVLKKEKKDIIGKKCYNVLHNEEKPQNYCPLSKCIQTRKAEKTEIYEKVSRKYYSIKTSPIVSENGEMLSFIGIMHDITPLKEKEKELKKLNKELTEQNANGLLLNKKLNILNKNYDLIRQYSSDAVVMYDENYRPVYVSPSSQNMVGYKPSEFKKLNNVFDIVHPDDRERLLKEIKGYRQKNIRQYITTYRVKHKNGHYFWNESVSHTTEEKGNIYVIINNRNIDKRKKSEQALKESEAKFKSYIENAPDGIFIGNEKGKFLEINQAAIKITGFSKAELLKMSYQDLIYEQDYLKAQKHFQKVIEIGNASEVLRTVTKNKELRYWSVAAVKLSEDRFLGFTKDITTRIQAQEDTKLLAEMVDTAPSSITIHDENGKFLYANKKTFEIHGFSADEFMSQNLNKLDVPQCAKLIKKRIDIVKKNGSAVFEVEHYKKNRSTIPLEVYLKLVNWKGTPAMLSIATDITERKEWMNELINAKEKAEESNKLKSQFLHNMSHEIRTPMNGIIGFSQILDNSDLNKDKRKYYSKIIQNCSQQLLRIIDDILEISTLETKQERLNETEFCLNDFIMDLFSIFNLKANEKKIPIYLKKPLRDNQSYIFSDKTKLNKVLSNLLENALKFTMQGFIEFGYFLKKPNLVLYIKDTGIGILPKNHKRIFERFSQEDKEISRKHGGLGLGLSISKENTQLLGGHIALESEKGNGTTFYVTIPYKPVNKLNDDLSSSSSDHSATLPKDNYTILVAEDEEINYLYIETLFQRKTDNNYNLIHVKNGKEAVDYCMSNQNVDLVLMDIKMPIMDGHEASEIIKLKFPDLPIIAQTAYSTKSDKELAINYGCDDFISKPIDSDKLFELVNKYIIMR